MAKADFILTICGSDRPDSRSRAVLEGMARRWSDYAWHYFDVSELPLFTTQPIENEIVQAWQRAAADSRALVIVTPEYIHNIPAQLKNALEWLTAGGQLAQKPTLALIYTPHAPRGEAARDSLVASLTALDTRTLAAALIHHTELYLTDGNLSGDEDVLAFLAEQLESI